MWLILTILIVGLLTFVIKRQYTFWERKKIPYVKPKIPFGNLDAIRRGERSFGLIMYDIYCQSKDKITGIYLFFRPALLVRDAEFIRNMLTTDFQSFHDRGISDANKNLFSLSGQEWKTLRMKLTPSFSTGKLKGMFGTIDDVGGKMVKHINKLLDANGSQVLEMKDILTTYAIDIIGSVIFGLDLDSYTQPNNEFREASRKLFEKRSYLQIVLNVCSFVCPQIEKFILALGVDNPTIAPLRDIVRRTIEYREKHNIIRKDMLQMLIQLRNTGKINEDDKNWDVETTAGDFKSMSIDMITAQLFLFYVAGSETTAATASFTIYELAMYPKLLDKAQAEVMECLERHQLKSSDKLTYEALQEMKFLELCIMETTRKYPGLPFLNRECTKDFQVPGTKYTIEKGTPIIISLLGLHRDPEYFPNPMGYEPERFLSENQNYNPTAYMPFGEGPRHCIAQRMGMLNSKVALVKILSNFNVEPMARKELEFKFDPAPILLPKGGLNIRLSQKTI